MRTVPAIGFAAIVAASSCSFFVTPAKSQLAINKEETDDLLRVSKDDFCRGCVPGIMWIISITSRAELIIQNVIVNRGCKVSTKPVTLPEPIHFGETKEYDLYGCDPIEVQVITDRGSETFTWGGYTQNSLSVSKNNYAYSPMWDLVLTNRADDSMTIISVVVNRGNCKFSRRSFEPPKPLKFGEREELLMMLDCNPIEVQVTTDHGNSIFNLE